MVLHLWTNAMESPEVRSCHRNARAWVLVPVSQYLPSTEQNQQFVWLVRLGQSSVVNVSNNSMLSFC